MTPALLQEALLDHALAEALGYLPEHIRFQDGFVYVFRPASLKEKPPELLGYWRRLRHTDPDVLWPLVCLKKITFQYDAYRHLWIVTAPGHGKAEHADLDRSITLAVTQLKV